jgi:hypothetical protein
MLFGFSGVTSPAAMLRVIVGLVILGAVALHVKASRAAMVKTHCGASIYKCSERVWVLARVTPNECVT